jgi:predicted GNAT family acetyltransferase
LAIHIEHFGDAGAFLARVQPFLERNEAAHNLLLGLAGELAGNPHMFGESDPWLAAVADEGQVLGAALRTPPQRLSISLIDALRRDVAVAALVDAVAAAYSELPGVSGPAESVAAFAERWQMLRGQPYHRAMALRIYQLTHVTPPQGVLGQLRQAGERDRLLLRGWIAAFQEDAFGVPPPAEQVGRAVTRWLTTPGRSAWLWEHDGQPVSMTGCAGPTPHGIRIGAVYTPPELRGRGYASACVAAASQRMLGSGRRFCFLFTDLANPTSNKIYQRIGYRPVCDVVDLDFGQGPA